MSARRPSRYHALALLLSALLLCAGVYAGAPSLARPDALSGGGVRVSFAPDTLADARALLAHVVPELAQALRVRAGAVGAAAADSGDDAEVHFSLAAGWRARTGTAAAEACARAAPRAGRATVACGGLLGLAYAVHDLREALLLAGARGGAAVVADFCEAAATAPAYGVRAWSEEGALLALPDRGYYTADGAAANTSAIAQEAAALEGEIVPALLRLRMNALIVLHSDIEDYVTYDSLPALLPGAPAIYAPDDAHRARRAGVISVMAPWIAHLRDDFGIAFHFQVYELSSPPGVCAPAAAGRAALFNCSLDAPATRALVRAKYGELRAALPALAGIFVTVEDSWTPRAGYLFNVLWSTQAQLPRVVTLFHDAIVVGAGLGLYFRLWVFGQKVDWPTLVAGSPPDVRFSVKQTQGDFLLDYPINELLQCAGDNATAGCPPRDRRIIVEVDAFRQYNGWGSGVAWMGPQWAPRLETARAAARGAPIDVWGWGSWAPGCTWPDSGPELINATAGAFKSWRSWWRDFRLFNGTATNGGFSLSGQANAYTLYRLAWDMPPANATRIALDFGTLYYGAENAGAIAELLAASIDAWAATSLPAALGDFTLFWTMMQHDTGQFGGLAARFTVADFDAPAAASDAAVARMAAALARVAPAAVPTPGALAGAARAVDVSRRYLAAAFAWRAAGLVVAQLGRAPLAGACADARARVATLDQRASAFGAAYPRESAAWVVADLDPALYSHPPFLDSSQRTMRGFVAQWNAQIDAVCK
jgi:hypothetical protein